MSHYTIEQLADGVRVAGSFADPLADGATLYLTDDGVRGTLSAWYGVNVGTCRVKRGRWGYRGDPNNRLTTWRGVINGHACYGRLTEDGNATVVHYYR